MMAGVRKAACVSNGLAVGSTGRHGGVEHRPTIRARFSH